MAILFSTLDGLKRAAKTAKRQTGMTHAQALDHVARAGGFQNFMDAARKLGEVVPTPRFPVTISQYWFEQPTKARGTERLTIHLSQPLAVLVRPHQLKGYLGGAQLQGEDGLHGYDRGDDQDYARKLVCRLARALQFMDATGLKPSTGKRFYPKGNWHNRPPGADHEHGWYDPKTRAYLFTDEPYGFGPETKDARKAWCERHGFDMLQSTRTSIYGYGTELYLVGKRGGALDVKTVLTKLEASPPPLLEKDWDRLAGSASRA